MVNNKSLYHDLGTGGPKKPVALIIGNKFDNRYMTVSTITLDQ